MVEGLAQRCARSSAMMIASSGILSIQLIISRVTAIKNRSLSSRCVS